MRKKLYCIQWVQANHALIEFQGVDLQKLILAHNNLEVLREDLRNLSSLVVLNISHNQLSSVPAAIGEYVVDYPIPIISVIDADPLYYCLTSWQSSSVQPSVVKIIGCLVQSNKTYTRRSWLGYCFSQVSPLCTLPCSLYIYWLPSIPRGLCRWKEQLIHHVLWCWKTYGPQSNSLYSRFIHSLESQLPKNQH